MKESTIITVLALVMSSAGSFATAAELGQISNYREYTSTFSSSGQPTPEQLKLIADEGFKRVVYIAMSNSGQAIAEEDAIVKELGMDYVHIPVIWDSPTMADFYAFADVMQRYPDRKSLLHCQVNYRASAFSLLYRVLYQGVSVQSAKADMNSVWQPNETWRDFIFAVLEGHDVNPHCEGCDWTPDE